MYYYKSIIPHLLKYKNIFTNEKSIKVVRTYFFSLEKYYLLLIKICVDEIINRNDNP